MDPLAEVQRKHFHPSSSFSSCLRVQWSGTMLLAPAFYIPARLSLLLGLCFSQISSPTSVCNSLKSLFVIFKITFEAVTASFIQTFYLCTSAHLSTDAFPVMWDQSYKQDYDLNWIILSTFLIQMKEQTVHKLNITPQPYMPSVCMDFS